MNTENLESQEKDVKTENLSESREIYENILNNYNDLEFQDFEPEKEKEIESEPEPEKEKASTKKIKPEKISLLDSGVTPEMAIQGLNAIMSAVSPLVYNSFSKEHKTNSKDWQMNQNDMNLLFVPVKMLLESIKIQPTNPYLATLGALCFVYGSKAIEVKNSYQNGVKMREPANEPNVKKRNSGGKYVKKWLDRKNGILNPEYKGD